MGTVGANADEASADETTDAADKLAAPAADAAELAADIPADEAVSPAAPVDVPDEALDGSRDPQLLLQAC